MPKKNHIILVAPYSPIGSCKHPALGQVKKITSVIRMLSRFERRIIFINSAHNPTHFNQTTVKIDTIDGVRVIVITPFTLANRQTGKILNMLTATRFARRLAQHPADLLWIYNGYAFESLFALEFLKHQKKTSLILEIEDWPTSRNRGLNNIKCELDFFYLKKVLPVAELITCVNQELFEQMISLKKQPLLFPSLLHPRVATIKKQHQPFSNQPYTVGYFGGLAKEKGTEVLLQLAEQLPENWQMVITGSGPMLAQCERVANKMTDRLTFFPNVDDEQLYSLMAGCDVIVNPHHSIKEMGNGIFPFKVFEALASARLVLSTPLPRCGMTLEEIVMWFDGSLENLREQLTQAKAFYRQRADQVEKIAAQIIYEYSEKAMFSKINLGLQI
ncbi:hypothetical protein PN36_27240 [Candidatus Thiomargarita nelsonii]|uniref:Glycosyl transferase family 1 domain-containing protein n=1 Tax=Candidatus Thiomargarita nelsonii TaxID=1003181 RepID=A0A0A6PD68_9GAMM|nr:hypothetical protein PN36_27240 [Candidatus Thiomargarita nelsonii]